MSADRITRRRFLRRTLLGGALLTLGGTLLRHASGYTLDPAIAARLRLLSQKEYLILAAICRRMLAPDEGGAASPDEIEAALVIDGYLAGLPEAITSDVRALLHLVEHTPFLFSLRFARFTRLDAAAQDAVLEGWATSRIDLRRRGFQALKALAMLGYYDDPRTFAILDYTGPMLPQALP
ncbi:MAG: hypothetical protein EXR72_18210 [Myxococcales bacterium]|nr:hypothetical protein [Myxococcales bacterium]